MVTPRAPIAHFLLLDDRPLQCESLLTRVGAYAQVIETTIPAADVAVSFNSTYLTQPGNGTVAAHALVGLEIPRLSWSRRIDDAEPGLGGEAFVLDHLFQLVDELTRHGHVAQIVTGETQPEESHTTG